jgi:integrase
MKYKTILPRELYERFDKLSKMLQHSQPSTIKTYIYILSKIPENVLKDITTSTTTNEIEKSIENLMNFFRDDIGSFRFIKNIGLVQHAVKNYLRSESRYSALSHFSFVIKPYFSKKVSIQQASQKMKYVPENVIEELLKATQYKLIYKKDASEELRNDPEYSNKKQILVKKEDNYEKFMMYYLIRVLSTSGLRISEALTTKFSNLLEEKDEKNSLHHYIKIESGKGGKTGKRVMTPTVYEELLHFKKKYKSKDDDLIFNVEIENINKDVDSVMLSKNRTSTKQLYILHRKCKKIRDELIKLGKIIKIYDNENTLTPHMFRHAVGMMLYKKGMPLDKIQQVLDHTNISTTQIYAHADKKEISIEFDKLMK